MMAGSTHVIRNGAAFKVIADVVRGMLPTVKIDNLPYPQLSGVQGSYPKRLSPWA